MGGLTTRLAIVVDSKTDGAITGIDKLGTSAEKAAAKVRAAADTSAAAQSKLRLAEIASARATRDLAAAQHSLADVEKSATATDEQKARALDKVKIADVKATDATRALGTAQHQATSSAAAYDAALSEQAVAATTASKALVRTKSSTDGLVKSIRGGVVTAAAAGGAAVALFGVKAVGAASDLGESTSKAGVLFGGAADSVEKFAATAAKSLGQSKAQATEAAGTFGNLFIAMGIGQQQSADLSISLVGLASDLASFNNSSPEDALEALRAGLLGEAEPLRKFGVQLSAARVQEEGVRLGLIKSANDVLPAAAKAQASYAIIMKDTTVAQGDFARTSNGLANQQRILTAQFQDFAATAGGIALPAVTKLFTAINAGLAPLTDLIAATGGSAKFIRDFGLSFIALAGGLGIARKAMDLLANSNFGTNVREQFAEAVSGAVEAAAVSGKSVGGIKKVGIGLGALVKSVGPVGIALTVGAGLLALFGQKSREADARVGDLTKSINEQGGAISKSNRESAAQILATNGILEAGRKVGLDTRLLTSAYLGNQDARKKVNDAVNAGIAQAPQASRAVQTSQSLTKEQISAYFDLRNALGVVFTEYDKSTTAQATIAAATEDVTAKTRTWTTVAEDNKEKLDAQKAASDRLKTSIDLLSGANIDVTTAQIAYIKAQQALTAGIKETTDANKGKKRSDQENVTSLDAVTASGQKNLTNITALAQAAGAYATAVAQRSSSEEAGRLVLDKARTAFAAQAKSIGFTKTQVDALVAAYFRVPARVPTKLELDIAAATKRAAAIQRTIHQIKGKTVTVQVTQDGGIQRVQREIDRITGRVVSITINPGSPGAKKGFSVGGEVTGGTPGKDSVSALLMPGERVLTRAENRLWKLGQRGGQYASTAMSTGTALQLDPVDRALLRAVAVAAGSPVRVSGELRARRGDLVAVLDRSTVERERR